MSTRFGKGKIVNGRVVFTDANNEVLFSNPVGSTMNPKAYVPVVVDEKPVVIQGFVETQQVVQPKPVVEEKKEWFIPRPYNQHTDAMPWVYKWMERKQAKQEPVKKETTLMSKVRRIAKTFAEDFGL